MPDQPKETDALLELERRGLTGDPSITPEIKAKVKAKLDAYRQQGLLKPFGKPLPEPARKDLEKNVGIYSTLKTAGGSFNDEYAGNTITGGLENSIQSLNSDFGTPGQRDWWSRFKSVDNQIRNDLFGSALTETEKAAYEATTISPNMDPKIIRQNLAARQKIIQDALKRQVGVLRGNKYDPDALDAAVGQFGADFIDTAPPPADPEAKPTDDGSGEVITPEDREYQRQESKLFRSGGNRAQFDELAQKYGRGAYGADLDAALKLRDEGKAKDATFLITPSGKKEPSAIGAMANSAAGSYFGGAADVLSGGFMDEIAPIFGGDTGQTRLAQDAMASEHPIANIAGQFTGGALIPFGRGAKTAQELGKVGGIMGGVYGVGSGDTLEDRVKGGTLGALSGYGLGYGGGKLLERFVPKPMPPSGGGGSDIMAAADRLNVDPLPADVGGPTVGKITSATAQTPLGAGPIVNRSQKLVEGVADAAANAAGGVKADGYATGRAAQRGMDKWIGATETKGGKLYEDIPISPDAPSSLSETKATLSKLNNKITSNPELAGLVADKKLAAYEQALSKGGLSWNDLKQFRSLVGEKLDGMILQQDTAQSDLRALYGSLSQDMEATARAQGPEALAKFQRANTYWRARQDRLENVATAILGKDKDKGAQAAFNQIVNWSTTRGESQRIGQMMRSLPKDEADIVSGAMIDMIGKATPGKQDASGEAFSLATFLTNWNKIDQRAKVALFNPQQRSVLDDIAKVAEGSRNAQQYANSSNTGGINALLATMGAVSGSATLLASGKPLLAALTAAPVLVQRPLGKLLASPVFARWLVNAPARSEQMAAHVSKLDKMAAKNPAIANELSAVERWLLSGANDNAPTTAAASDNENGQGQ